MWQLTILTLLGFPSFADSFHRAFVVMSTRHEELLRTSWLHWRPIRACFFVATLGNAVMLSFEVEGYSGSVLDLLPHLFAGILATEIFLSIYTYGWWILALHAWLLWNFVTVHLALWVFSGFFLRILGILRVLEYATGGAYEALRGGTEAAIAEETGQRKEGGFFAPLRKLSMGLTRGFNTLVWSLIVIGVSVFFFGTLAESMLEKNESINKTIYFGNLSESMFSLFQMLTLSGWSQSIIRKFVETGEVWFGGVMVFYILFSVLIVMNLLTAVIIEGAFRDIQVSEEQELIHQQIRQARVIEEVKMLLNEAVPPTSDDTNCIKHAEFERLKNSHKFERKLQKLNIKIEELDDIFNLFDEHNKKSVNIEEICAGFIKLKSNITAKEIYSCVAHLKALTGSLEKISDAQGYRALQLPLERLEQELLPQLADDIGKILTNLDRTLVAIQRESMGKLTESFKASLPPRPTTPPKPEKPKEMSGFSGGESGASKAGINSQQTKKKQLRFEHDN